MGWGALNDPIQPHRDRKKEEEKIGLPICRVLGLC